MLSVICTDGHRPPTMPEMRASLLQGRSREAIDRHPVLDKAADQLRQWFLTDALTTWREHGVDWSGGGFFERLTAQAQPHEEPRRTRVVARQIYVFCVAHRLGWQGDALALTRHGLNFLLNKLLQSDGLFASSVTTAGQVVDTRFDLYEQAFALFALAHAYEVCPDIQAKLLTQADATLDALNARYKHPLAGYQESCLPTVPLKANPHMHLFEAALAWEAHHEAGSRWHRLSDELGELALRHLIDRDSGALYELFDERWQPLSSETGLIVEPGHQFEWGWLLIRWGTLRARSDALLAAKRLIAVGQTHGVCARRHVAINQLDAYFQVTDGDAKLWPQTEWIKACHALSHVASSPQERLLAVFGLRQSIGALRRYLQHPFPGLWHEVMTQGGGFQSDLCRASSLYHIVCAIDTLQAAHVGLDQDMEAEAVRSD